MQVQPGVQSAMYNSHSQSSSASGHHNHNHIHSNGIQLDPGQHHSPSTNGHYSPSTNGHIDHSEMHPYPNNPYAYGLGQPQYAQQHPQQQRQYYQPNQLAQPMQFTGGVPPLMAPPPAPGMPPGMPPSGLAPPHYPQVPGPPPLATLQPVPSGQPATLAGQQPATSSSSGHNGTHKFELKVEQQPQRARMCGFGDKDRRPITPPPCIRLIITDLKTNQPVSPEEVDGTFFVLQVDLWDETGVREVNLVRNNSTSPSSSISTATTTSYPPTTPDHPKANDYQLSTMYAPQQMYAVPGYATPMGTGPSMPSQGFPAVAYYPQNPYGQGPASYTPQPLPQQPAQASHSMFTRNLIGSLTVNASRLNDLDGEPGYWFVLQDLSVRTEGFFRLKMNFIDVGAIDGGGLNRARAPVLAVTRSEPFQVFSAKKFPGVIESTPLSKIFATQGIKIPIRKDNKGGDGEDDE